MTTYEQGHAPEGAPVTWCGNDAKGRDAAIYGATEPPILVARQHADAICRAFHLAKLAEDYVRACDRSDELSDSDPFIETAEGRARAKAADAARAAMVKAVRA